MFVIWYLVLAVISAAQIRGINIMLKKPSVQPSTYSQRQRSCSHNCHYYTKHFPSTNANDGSKTGLPSRTQAQDPYWQGDLQGFYTVTSISVTSDAINGWAVYLRKALIGVSVHDVSCFEGEVTSCGEWPDETLSGHTLAFNCSFAGPVRYVRIWREGINELSLGEVEVEGIPSRLPGTVYDKFMLKKVIRPTTSLSVANVKGCGTMCHRTQPCLAFSYSPFEQPNCLLATDVSMRSDVKWLSYKVRTCFNVPPCDLSGFF